jgi:HK97 family phage portal protein
MGFFDNVRDIFRAPQLRRENDQLRSRVEPVSQLDLANYLGGGPSWVQIDIDRLVALGLPIVWACCKVLGETFAQFPCILYERTPEGRKRADDHPMFDLLHMQPNPQQDSFSYKEQAMGHLCIYGNHYSNQVRNGTGYVKELWPLNPERMFPFRLAGELLYRYRASPYFQTQDLFFRDMADFIEKRAAAERAAVREHAEWVKAFSNGKRGTALRDSIWSSMGDNPYLGGMYKNYPDQVESILTADEVFHVHGMSFDGIRGYSPLELQKQTFGIAVAAKHFSGDYFANNGTPDLALKFTGRVSEAAQKRLQKSWKDNHSAHGKKHTPLILEDGGDVKELTPDAEKAQLVNTQMFLIGEVARIYRIPPHLLQDLERATFSNIEHQAIEFVQMTMLPWCSRWESAVALQLLGAKERKRFFVQHHMDSILRGDAKTRAEVYTSYRAMGVMNADEVREEEGKNPVGGPVGQDYFVLANWMNVTNPKPEPVVPGSVEAPLPEGDTPDSANSPIKYEKRTLRSAHTRKAIADSFTGLFKDAAGRIVKREKREITRACEKFLGQRSEADLKTFVDRFYSDLPDYIRSQVTPIYSSFSNAIKAEIANELNIDESIKPDDEKFVHAFVDAFCKRYIGSSQGQLNQIIRESAADAVAENIQKRLDEWEQNRPDKVAANETVQASNAFAKNLYRLAGIAALVWVNTSAKPCPYCQQMDGTQIGIEQDFAYKGEQLPDDERSLSVFRNVGHPPLHAGCECQLMAG